MNVCINKLGKFKLFIIKMYCIYSIVVSYDHTNNDCLALVVLSHGINSSYIYAQDSLYPVETLWNSFTPNKCPSLAGKPKLFFIQVICRDSLPYSYN